MKQQVYIAIVGMPGAGKSETAAYFHKHKYPLYRFGDQTDIGLRKEGKKITQENERQYREKLRSELGMAAYAMKIYERIEKDKPAEEVVVLDGLYSWEEYVYLSQKWENLKLLCIYARPHVRYQRLSKRKIRPLSQDEARKRDIAELEKLNKGGPIALADHLIINETSIQDLHERLDSFLHTLL